MQNFYLSKNAIIENTDFWKENTEKDYVDCIQKIIKSKPFGDHKFYIFSFVKRIDDTSGTKKMYHQPRLTKPEPVPGTTLMRVNPNNPGEATIMWTLPNQENFGMYKAGKMFADQFVHKCVEQFKTNPLSMAKPEPDDLTDNEIQSIYRGIAQDCARKKASKTATKVFSTK